MRRKRVIRDYVNGGLREEWVECGPSMTHFRTTTLGRLLGYGKVIPITSGFGRSSHIRGFSPVGEERE